MYTGNVLTHGRDVRAVLIAIGAPTWYKGIRYEALAPTHDLFVKYANGLSWDDYTRIYKRDVLKKLDAAQVVSDICKLTGLQPEGEDSAILCCWCNVDKDVPCHRTLVAEWLEQELGLKVKELPRKAEVIANTKRYGFKGVVV